MPFSYYPLIKRYNGTDYDPLYPITDWCYINNKPSTFTPSSHSHAVSDITDIATYYARLSAANTFSSDQTYSGYLRVQGTAGEHHLMTRGICGSDGSTTISDLYLQYGTSYSVRIGSSGQCVISSAGAVSAPSYTENGTTLSSKYLGITATATNSDKVDSYHVWTGTAAAYGAIGTYDSSTIYFVTA